MQWDRNDSPGDSDGFEIKRIGDCDTQAKICIQLYHSVEKYKLAGELAGILNMSVDTMANIVFAFWNYVKVRNGNG